jgi:hypothetical protein
MSIDILYTNELFEGHLNCLTKVKIKVKKNQIHILKYINKPENY